MPTSFTVQIEDGNTNARDFVTHCTRAFTTFIHQREEDIDSPPRPVEVKEDSYYATVLVSAQAQLNMLLRFSPEGIEKGYAAYFDKITQSNIESIQRHADMVAKYQSVKDKVEAWEPNEEASPVKKYALEQLDMGWPYDPHISTPVETPEEWYENELKFAREQVEYYGRRLQDEQDRLQERREYAIKMLESIAEVPE